MSQDATYDQLVKKMQEVSTVQPQTVGWLTPLYHRLIPLVKTSPWKVFFAGSFTATLILYLVFGVSIVYVANLLQHGF
jgi:hypothetical protein